MTRPVRNAIAVAGALALVSSVVTDALASQPSTMHQHVRAYASKDLTVTGKLTVNNVLRVKKNTSVYGKLYAHGGSQVWSGLLVNTGGLTVKTGGVTADSLKVSGNAAADSLSVAGAVQAGTLTAAGAITGQSLAVSGAASVGNNLTVTGSIAGNGIDAGTGGLHTSGGVTAGTLAASGSVTAASLNTTGGTCTTGVCTSTINASGGITAHDLTITSTFAAPSANFTNLTVSGTVNFTGATVTGINPAGSLGNATAQTLAVGTTTSTAVPLTISANGRTAQVSVDSSGALSVPNLVVNGSVSASGALAVSGATTLSGGVTVTGGNGVVASNIQAPNATGSSSPGTLTLTGSNIALTGSVTANGNVAISNGGDLNLSTSTSGSSTVDSHINANGATDLAGVSPAINVTTTAPSANGFTWTYTFHQGYAVPPIVTVTAASDPAPSGGFGGASQAAPRVWVTVTTAGFTIHYVPPATVVTPYPVSYYYHVIGQ